MDSIAEIPAVVRDVLPRLGPYLMLHRDNLFIDYRTVLKDLEDFIYDTDTREVAHEFWRLRYYHADVLRRIDERHVNVPVIPYLEIMKDVLQRRDNLDDLETWLSVYVVEPEDDYSPPIDVHSHAILNLRLRRAKEVFERYHKEISSMIHRISSLDVSDIEEVDDVDEVLYFERKRRHYMYLDPETSPRTP